MIEVELVYDHPDGKPRRLELELQDGSQIADAVDLARRLPELAGLPLVADEIGIYGLRCAADTVLKQGDRIECYAPLRIDPKDARRTRARGQKR